VPAGQLLEGLLAELDRVDPDRSGLGASDRLEWLRQVAPDDVDELLERRLQAEAEAGWRNRLLRLWPEAGSMRFEGSLPRVEGEAWAALIHAHAEAARRTAIEARDPLTIQPTKEQRRCDALISLIRHASKAKPVFGAGTAKVLVTLDYDQLAADAAGAGLMGSDQRLFAAELRRLCCEAELIPVVLGGASEVLDVGRSSRLVTPAIRTALIARDGGCVFPGCSMPAEACEAHHIVPWRTGGGTPLANLTLQCHTHHGVVEPAKYATRDQWEVRIAADGLPEFLPPRRLDPERKPLRHTRHAAPARAG